MKKLYCFIPASKGIFFWHDCSDKYDSLESDSLLKHATRYFIEEIEDNCVGEDMIFEIENSQQIKSFAQKIGWSLKKNYPWGTVSSAEDDLAQIGKDLDESKKKAKTNKVSSSDFTFITFEKDCIFINGKKYKLVETK